MPRSTSTFDDFDTSPDSEEVVVEAVEERSNVILLDFARP